MNNQAKGRLFTTQEVLDLLDDATVNAYDAGVAHAADLLLQTSNQAINYSQLLNQLADALIESIGSPLEEEEEEKEEEEEEEETTDDTPEQCNISEKLYS